MAARAFLGRRPDQESPDPVAFEQEEDQDEQRQDQAGGEVPGGAPERQGPAEDAAAVVLQRGGGVLDVLVDLGGRQVQRAFRQPGLDLLHARQRLGPQLAEALHELAADQGQGADDQRR